MSVPTVSPIPKARTGLLRRMYKHRWAYILLIPVIVFFIIFHYVPMYGIVLAFKKYMIRLGIIGSPWTVSYTHLALPDSSGRLFRGSAAARSQTSADADRAGRIPLPQRVLSGG